MNELIKAMSILKTGRKNYFFMAFIIAFAMAACVFIPFMIADEGFFLYYGDFNVQQVPFYQMIHDAVRSGNFMWNFTTDLGANTIGSYSFYLMGSPFFWLTIPFSSEAVPYLMGPLLILKISCASLAAYTYLRRYVINQNYAVIGAVIYAFSGFSIYNIFFNHFHEAIIAFPLLLAAVDGLVINKKRGLVIGAVFLSCFMNYYFFVGQFVFCVIYWFVKVYYGRYKFRVKEFAYLLIEGILGLLGTAVLLVPTILCVTQNPRLDNFPYGWGTLLYGNEQRYLHILQCLFFPPDIPARPNFTPDSDAKWASLGAWLPFVGMSGVIAYFKLNKRKWLKTLLVILFFMAGIPILNSAFQGFNMSYYARWYYMLTLMMVLAAVQSFESIKTKWKSPIRITFFITAVIALAIGMMPNKKTVNGEVTYTLGLMNYPDRYWIYVGIALISILLFAIVIKLKDKNKKKFFKYSLISVALISVFYSIFVIALGKSQSYSTKDFIIPYLINKEDDIDLPDKENCRIDVYDGMDNTAMFWQIPTIQAFHSIVPGSVMEFYPSVGVTRDVGSRPETKYYGLRAFLSVRWLFGHNKDCRGVLPGFEFYKYQNGFDILENQYYIPMGFAYNEYITENQYYSVAESNRHLLLLKAMVLSEDAIERNGDILKNAENVGTYSYMQSEYFKDCEERRLKSCSSFSRDNSGFSAEYTAGNSDELIFFSVPYEDGFTAYVNGEEAVIEKVNIGFMAVRVPADTTSEIRFDYFTPGLTTGFAVTLLAVVLIALYLFVMPKIDKNFHPIKKKFRLLSR